MSKNLNQIRTLFLSKVEQFKKIEEQYLISLTKQAVSTECWQLIACCLPSEDKLKLSMINRYYNEVVFGQNSHVFVWRDGANDVEKPHDHTLVESINLNMPVKVIRHLMTSKANPNQTYEDCSILMYSTYKGNVEIVQVLLEANADVNICGILGLTALTIATKFPQIMDILIKAGADVNAQNINGCTALMEACFNGHKNAVKLLLDAHADVNIRDTYSQTALYYARCYNRTNVIQMLLKHGAIA
jgi:hypothetical protein